MTNKLKPCPFCGSDKLENRAEGGSDERVGYNFTHTIRCQDCGCRKSAGSKRDGNGWCIEDHEAVSDRAEAAWNQRTLHPLIEALHAKGDQIALEATCAQQAEMIKNLITGVIVLTPAEIQSKYSRVQWAEGLIRQLPEDHEGRNSWLLNYGEYHGE